MAPTTMATSFLIFFKQIKNKLYEASENLIPKRSELLSLYQILQNDEAVIKVEHLSILYLYWHVRNIQ